MLFVAALVKEFITCQSYDERVSFIDFIEQRLKSDPVARKILAMNETATREFDTQALGQILIGRRMTSAGGDCKFCSGSNRMIVNP